MTIRTAIDQLLECEAEEKANGSCRCAAHLVLPLSRLTPKSFSSRRTVFTPTTLCVGVARIGNATQCIVAGNAAALRDVDFGGPLHSLVVVGETHELERDYLAQYMINATTPMLSPDPTNEEDEQ